MQLAQGTPYLYQEPPKLSGSPIPSAGPAGGGTRVTIRGTGFAEGQVRPRPPVLTLLNAPPAPHIPDAPFSRFSIRLHSAPLHPLHSFMPPRSARYA